MGTKEEEAQKMAEMFDKLSVKHSNFGKMKSRKFNETSETYRTLLLKICRDMIEIYEPRKT